ncbi:L-gulonolactone oxidase [Cytospora mali]|uniref:D-arabinono-1,4-lactone oxidase n=1 Tax=Cytospora mali TaxID=578113 RepID=A0A194VZ20_CYTMA|nr:L-gulonolactone oxidase [Valsa mali]
MRTLSSLIVQLLLAAPLVSAYRWYNWEFDITCEATSYFVPEDEDHLASFVRSHQSAQSMIKVVGNGHAFGNMTTCVDVHATNRTSHIVSLVNLKHLHVNPDNTATIGAGWDLVDVIPELRNQGLSLFNIGSERVQNFVGAFTTGTHGTGRGLGNIASQVVGFRVMDSSGEITVVNQTHNADLLPAFRISLGALGIITEVTYQAQPLKYLKRTTQVINTSENIEEIYSAIYDKYQEHERVLVYGPHLSWNESTSNYTFQPQMIALWWEDTNVTGVHNCSTDYCANDCAGVCQREFSTEFEHFIPVENFVKAATDYTTFELSQASLEKSYNNLYMLNMVRFVKEDDTWMSPVNKYNLGNDSSGVFAVLNVEWTMTYNTFDTLWFGQDIARQYIPKFGMQYNVRPHWGKMSWFNETYAEFAYPHLHDFLDVQERMDPNCQFVNEFLVDHLGIHRCANAFDSTLVPSIASLKRRNSM